MTPAKGYTEMKDSGIEWIGAIPAHWDILRGKNVLRLLERPVKPEDDVVTCFRDGEVTLRKNRREEGFTNSLKEIGYQGIEPGDLIVHGMDGFAGAIGISDSRGKASPVLNVMDSNQNKRYLMYYLRAMAYKDVFMALSTGIRVRSCDLRWNKLSVFPFLIPKSHEQSAIAAYLDTQCAKIDEIIAQAKASIEDYKQWKASIIYEAVTKGLDPNVEMKDSGIEWIGRMPKHWKCVKAGLLFKEFVRPYCDGDIPLSLSQQDGLIPTDEMKENSLKTASYENWKRVIPDDLVLNRFKAHLGVFFASKYNGCVSFHYGVFHAINDSVLPRYYEYLFHSEHYKSLFAQLSNGITVGLQNLSNKNFYNAYVHFPDIEEQIKIVRYLTRKCTNIDEMITEKHSLIDDLESYKKSLIYEAVTGKRRVENISEITISILSPEVLRHRKALLMLRVLDLLGDDTRGRIQLQKCMFAAECLLNMPFHTQYVRYKHGPYDPQLQNFETILSSNGWYTVLQGSPVTYQKGNRFEEGLKEYMNTYSDIDSKLKKIVDFFRPMKTSQAERVATLLAAWNDYILDGTPQPTDKEIIDEVVTHWTPNKANPQYSTWQDTLRKMRENQFIPIGVGVHTLQKKS